MRSIISTLAIAAGAATLVVAPVASARERMTGEQELAKILEGRVAGEPTNCLPTWRNANLRIVDGTALVYDAGRTIYVNIPQRPETLDDDDILVTEIWGGQLCRLDHVRTIDRSGGFLTGVVFLNKFVPYRKAS